MKIKDNCFDVIRIFAALQVILFHYIAHFQITSFPVYAGRFFHLFSGVVIFFAISSFLITASYERCIEQKGEKEGKKEYIRKRLLRIYPPLWLAFGVSCICIVGLFDWSILFSSIKQLVIWVVASITCAQFYTPDVLREYGVGAPNGSLWTICVELQFYIVILLTYKFLKKASNKIWILLLLTAGVLNYTGEKLEQIVPEIVYKLFGVSFLPYAYILFLGMYICIHREKIIPFIVKHVWKIWLIFLLFSYISRNRGVVTEGVYYSTLGGALLSVLILATAYKFVVHIKVELSYEIYLYHMVIANAFIEKEIMGLGGALAAFVITLLVSALAYYITERRVIKGEIKQ